MPAASPANRVPVNALPVRRRALVPRPVRAVGRNALVAIGVIVLWEVLVTALAVPPVIFPDPVTVFQAFGDLVANGFGGIPLSEHLSLSAFRILSGFGLGVVLGMPLGFAMGRAELVRGFVTPFIALIRPLPAFAYLAVLLVWFGIGEGPKVAVVLVGAVSIMTITTMDAVRRIPSEYEDSARTLGATRFQVYRHVLLPSALPTILDGARVAMAQSWTCVIAAEFVAAREGVGVIILQAADYLRTDQTVAGLILVAILGGLSDLVLVLIARPMQAWRTR